MKGMSRGKLRTIIALNFVVIALLLGLFFLLPKDKGLPTASGGETHSRVRTANISLNPNLSWELQLRGSESETAVATFVREGYVYIFGNTESSDLDFDRAGIFLSIVDVYGVVKAFFILGEEGDVLKTACLCEGGFLLGVEGETSPRLLLVDYSGEVKSTISGFLYSFEHVLNIKSYRDGYLLFTAPQNNLTGVRSLRCCFFSEKLSFVSSYIAVSSYSLDLFDSVVVSGKPIAICNATSTLHTVPALVEFSKNESAKVKVLTDCAGEIAGVSVYDGDLLLLTAFGGSSLLRLTTGGVVVEKTTLSQLRPLGFSEVGNSDEQRYLAFLDTAVYLINGKGECKSTLPAFSPSSRSYYDDVVIYAGGNSGGGMLNVYSDEKVVFSAKFDGGENHLLAVDERNLFCIYESDGDVFIVKLRYPLFW